MCSAGPHTGRTDLCVPEMQGRRIEQVRRVEMTGGKGGRREGGKDGSREGREEGGKGGRLNK